MSVYLMNQCNENVMKGTHIHHCDLPTTRGVRYLYNYTFRFLIQLFLDISIYIKAYSFNICFS